MNLVLIGGRGVGKSTTALALATLTGRPVLSLDILISLDQGGRSIPDLLRDFRGDWRFFREMEFQVVRKVCRLDHVILDCGGGVVVDLDPAGEECLSQRKIDLLQQNSLVVWLRKDHVHTAKRVIHDPNRPALHRTLTESEIMRRRIPFYQAAANLVIDIAGLSPREVATRILPHCR